MSQDVKIFLEKGCKFSVTGIVVVLYNVAMTHKRILLSKTMRRFTHCRRKFALVDICDFEGVSKYAWSKSGDYAVSRINKKSCQMANFILGKREGFVVDHINGNGLDNRRKNLEFVTQRENIMRGIRLRRFRKPI